MGCPIWGNEQRWRSGGRMWFSDHWPSHWLSAAWLCVVAVCVVAVAGCSGNSPAVTTTSPGSTSARQQPSSPSPSSPADAAEQSAVQAYLGMWQAMATAGTTSNWQAPELAKYATGNALTTITRSLYADHYNHVVTRGAPVNHPAVSSGEPAANPTTVMIADCGDSTHSLKYKEGTDQLADNTPGGRRSITAEVQRQADGAWRVDQFAVEGLGTC